MICLRKVFKGDDGIVHWPFLNKNGDQLDLTHEDVTVTAYVYQNGKVKATYVMGQDPELRTQTEPDADTYVLEFEYTKELTSLLGRFVTSLRVMIDCPDEMLEVDDPGRNTFEKQIFKII